LPEPAATLNTVLVEFREPVLEVSRQTPAVQIINGGVKLAEEMGGR